jgi:hypothetical protein
MQESTRTLSGEQVYTPTRFTRFLWWLSTADEALIVSCTVDRSRYAVIGYTVLSTWLFATGAWIYFFSTLVYNPWLALPLGLLMGGIILMIDRALIKGISKGRKNIVPILFRGLLAIAIGLFMAQPALLYLFDKEIRVQISVDNEQRILQKQRAMDSVFGNTRKALLLEKGTIENELKQRYSDVQAARNTFLQETDGTGGSKKIGLKDIAQAKQEAYRKTDADYQSRQSLLQPRLQSIDSSLMAIAQQESEERKKYAALLNDGFLTRIEALQHLVDEHPAMAFRYYLLVMILLLIELMPVLSKWILPSGAYEETIRLQEAMDTSSTQKHFERLQSLQETYNSTAHELDAQTIRDFFEAMQPARKEKIKAQVQVWQQRGDSFSSGWEKLKEELLSRPEN